MRDVSRPGRGLVHGTVEYRAGEQVWRHTFEARRLNDAGRRQVLAAAGLALDRYLTGDHTSLCAVPVP